MADNDDNCILPGFLGSNDVIINGWIFCEPHGLEWCHICTVDHRGTNNVQVEDDLTAEQYELLTDYGIEDFADREQIRVKNLWKRMPGGKVCCRTHSRVGCNTCFNFLQQLTDRAAAIEAEEVDEQAAADAAVAAAAAPPAAAVPQAAAALAAHPQQPPAVAAAAVGPHNACWHCQEPRTAEHRLMKCARCQQARYCNRDCQLAHWPTHRPQCRQLIAAAAGDAAHG